MEDPMKKFVAVLALASVVFAVPVSAKNMCIDSRDIVSSNSKDGRTMVFKMRDGRTLVNHLQGVCSDLKFNGFVWRLQSGDTQVCENTQSLQVIQSGQVCVLGKFDPATQKQATK
jgi:hypothetical protein